MTDEIQIAWAAGLFEGEGCISKMTDRRSKDNLIGIQLILSMSDRDVVEQFHSIVKVGNICETIPSYPNAKLQYRWSATSYADVLFVLGLIGELLGERRTAKYCLILSEIENQPRSHGKKAFRKPLCQKMFGKKIKDLSEQEMYEYRKAIKLDFNSRQVS